MHGAGSDASIFAGWGAPERGIEVAAVDLQEGLDVAAASMGDYAATLTRFCESLPRPPALCGWSMGGLVAMMAAPAVEPQALVLIEPSAPAEVQGTAAVADAIGTFDPEVVYGAFPEGAVARPESARARADRKRGISVPELPRRTLVIYGDEFADERGRALVERYGVEGAHFPGLDHWGLVRSAKVRERVLDHVAAS